MIKKHLNKKTIAVFCCFIVVLMLMILFVPSNKYYAETSAGEKKFIKYVEFNVPYSLLKSALDYDIKT